MVKNKTARIVIALLLVIVVGGALVCGALVGFGLLTSENAPGFLAQWFPQPPSEGNVVDIPEPEPGAMALTAATGTTIHSGPGDEYPIVGYLEKGRRAEVIGTSDDGEWWVINIPGVMGGQGWVSAESVTTENVEAAPVVQPGLAPPSTPRSREGFADWNAEYFDNADLKGTPVLSRTDAYINFNWGDDSPNPKMPADNFSVRWTKSAEVPEGTYGFSIWVSGGARLLLDGEMLINGWVDGPPRNYLVEVDLAEGEHTAIVEYFDSAGDALIIVNAARLNEYPDWKAEYYDNPTFVGEPVLVRNETELIHDWGDDSPAPGLPADAFSVRWTRKAHFEEGTYTYRIDVAGAVHLWMDDITQAFNIQSEPLHTQEGDIGRVTAGWHTLRVDYSKRGGEGQIEVDIRKKQ